MDTIAERVAKGAAWLDEQRPGWWREGPGGIDLGRLEMRDVCMCVLGQVYAEAAFSEWHEDDGSPYESGFEYAADALAAPAVAGGFDTAAWTPDLEYRERAVRNAEYAELGTEWKRLIAERRAAS
jgi:hypothetical protein